MEKKLEDNEDSFWPSNSLEIELGKEEALQLEKVIEISYFEDMGEDD